MPLKHFPSPLDVPVRRKDAGTTTRSDGYVMEYCPENPRRNKRGYVLQHILVVEVMMKRFLLPSEKVHHINRNRSDNSPKNLTLERSQGTHLEGHTKMRDKKILQKLKGLASNPHVSLKDAEKILKLSHTTISLACKRNNIEWICRPLTKETPLDTEYALQVLRTHSREEAFSILGISRGTFWRLYPELLRMTSTRLLSKQDAKPD